MEKNNCSVSEDGNQHELHQLPTLCKLLKRQNVIVSGHLIN